MKVGVLTLHMAHNCGAMLQSYALCKSIGGIPSCQCEIIDYRLPDIYDKYQRLLHSTHAEPRRLQFERYINEVLPTSQRIKSLSDAPKYDMYVLGGDQIWNPDVTKGYKDEYFATQFPPDSYCIAYAASTGRRVSDPEAFSQKLRHFKAIGVRESWLKWQLVKYFSKEIVWCLDPVLLIRPENWTSLCPPSRRSGYVLVYAFQVSDYEYYQIKRHADRIDLEIIELVTHNRPAQEGLHYEENYGPEEFVEYVRNAAYVYTDSYHGVLFSLIFGRPYRCLTKGRVQNDRISDLHVRFAIEKSKDGFFRAGDFTAKKLEEGQQESIQFLERMIGEIKYTSSSV